jgi:S1-C subfamily serine protease
VDLPGAIEAIRPSVVQVLLRSRSRGIQAVIGTAFIVHEKGYALTARHVTQDNQAQLISQGVTDGEFLIGLAQPNTENMRGNFTIVRGIVVEDPRHDVALLRLEPNPFEGWVTSGIVIGDRAVPLLYAVAPTRTVRPQDGEPIAVSGYPLSEPVMITTSGAIATAWGLDIAPMPMPGGPPGITVPDVKDSYLGDVAVNPGNSGGPVYSIVDAVVIGVCVAFRTASGSVAGQAFLYNSGLSLIVPIQYGLDLLARQP